MPYSVPQGQTGSGKTFTMEGLPAQSMELREGLASITKLRFSYQPGTVAKAPQAGSSLCFAVRCIAEQFEVRAESTSPENLGIVPRAIHGLFDRIDRRATTGNKPSMSDVFVES